MILQYETLLAIDPGASGAMVNVDIGSGAVDQAIPFTNWTLIADSIRGAGTHPFALIERVWASPIMSNSSAFAFGRNYGGWVALLSALGVPTRAVVPQVWQRGLDLPAGLQGPARKRALRDLAKSDLSDPGTPKRLTVNLDTCDALLLARYGLRELRAGRLPGVEVLS